MNFDIKTLIFVAGLINIIQIFIFWRFYTYNKTYKCIKWWLFWSIAEAVSYMVMFLRNIPSLFNHVVIIQNSSMIAGLIFLYIGILRFRGKKEKLLQILIPYFIFVIILIYYSYFDNDLLIRTVSIYLFISAILIISFYELLKEKKNPYKYLPFTFLFFGLIFFLRIIFLFTDRSSINFMEPDPLNFILFISTFSASILWTYGFILMINNKVNSELTESKDQLKLIFDTSPDAVIISRMSDGIIINVNNNFINSSGYTKEELLGNTTLSLALYADPSVRDNITKEILNSGFVDNYEAEFIKKDGSIIKVLLSASKIILDGISHYISISKDITDQINAQKSLIENEKKFRQIFERSSVGIVLVDLDKKFTACNSAFCNFIGYKEDELIGKTISDITYEEDIEIGMKELKLIIEGKLESFKAQKRYVTKDDKIVWGEINISLVRNTENKPLFFLPVIQNVTQKRETEINLNQSVLELKQMNQLMIDRELKMVELKKEINELLKKTGSEPKY